MNRGSQLNKASGQPDSKEYREHERLCEIDTTGTWTNLLWQNIGSRFSAFDFRLQCFAATKLSEYSPGQIYW